MNKRTNIWIWRIACAAAGLVFGAGVTWGGVRMQVKGLDKAVNNHEERLRDVEDGFARIETKLENIDGNIKEIKEVLK